MSKRELSQIIDALDTIKSERDGEYVSTEAMAELLRDIRDGPSWVNQVRMRKHERRLELWLQGRIEMTRAVLTFGQGAIRTLLVANGAAAIAVLSFAAAVVKSDPELVSEVARSLLFFSVGVALSAVVAAGAYVTQYLYDTSKGRVSKIGVLLHLLVLILATGSLASFCWGVLVAYRYLGSL